VRKLFKGGNYSWEETIRGNTVSKCCLRGHSIDTGHFFLTSLAQCLVFLGMVKNPKFEPFLRASEVLGASEAGKKKQSQLHHFLGKK
jgi:hypothetical protein